MRYYIQGLHTGRKSIYSKLISRSPSLDYIGHSHRQFTSISGPKESSIGLEGVSANYTKVSTNEGGKRKHRGLVDQDLLLDVLESTATKREAKAYLLRYGPEKTASRGSRSPLAVTTLAGVNLGNLYEPIRAVDAKSVFFHASTQPNFIDDPVECLHIALVKIRAPQSIQDETLRCVGHTLSQLATLGLSCVVVVDNEDGLKRGSSEEYKLAIKQANRIVKAISTHKGGGARRLDNVFSVSPIRERLLPLVKAHGGVHITQRSRLLAPLRRAIIPVIAPVVITSDTKKLVPVVADEVILALTREFSGIQTQTMAEDDAQAIAERMTSLQKQISLDRIIVLDPLGGIPSTDRGLRSHVFINLEQEFDTIKKDLLGTNSATISSASSLGSESPANDALSAFTDSNLISKSLASKVKSSHELHETSRKAGSRQTSVGFHVQNLELLRNSLALLPSLSSAFLTTPDDVANSQSRPPAASQGPRVRTRRQRNPLIHNLLTNKPVTSSSLPSHSPQSPAALASTPGIASSPATFFKRGIPVGIIPNPMEQAWAPPSHSNSTIDLSDPRIDLPRLFHLIDDSFGRTLDVPKYLTRIKDRIAGVIIAGEYEGGAILTWEIPPGRSSNDPKHMVPYLDKFAVLKRSQGAGGVADIVFKSMVRDCFPKGVCWRSRRDNPVNKWYSERARGTYEIPGTNWTMFWTTEGIKKGDEVFRYYEAVCKAVFPTWADKKGIMD